MPAELERAQAGQTVLVTDRGRVIAQLSAVRDDAFPLPNVEHGLARLSSSGALRVAERPSVPYAASPISVPVNTAQALLDEGRDEGASTIETRSEQSPASHDRLP